MAIWILCWPAAAHAGDPTVAPTTQATVRGSLKTYVRLWEDTSPTNRAASRFRLPILQTVHVSARDVGVAGLAMEVLGYGELDTIEPLTGDRGRGDLALANITYQGLADDLLFVRVGRQIIHSGAANNAIIDGLQLRLQLPYHLFVEAWGGFTAEPQFDQSAGKWQVGSRVAWNMFDQGHLGVSFAHERDDRGIAREVLGVDAAWRSLEWLEVVGYALIDTVEMDLDEVYLYAEGHYEREFRALVSYRRFNPAARIPKTSIFSVFANSEYDELTTSVSYRPQQGALSLHAAASVFFYPGGGNGLRFVFRPRWLFNRLSGELVGLELSRVESVDNAYWSVRAYGTWAPLNPMFVTLDTENAFYDENINNHMFSSITRLNLGFELTEGLNLLVEGGVTLSPTYEQQWLAMVRLTYHLSGASPSREVAP